MRFIGRSAELETLAEQVAAVGTDRRLRVVLVLAAPGMGASGLVEEFARRTPGVRTVRASAPRHTGGPPMRIWHRLLAELGAETSAQDDAWALEQRFVASAGAATAGQDGLGVPGALVCVLDDLHRADEATVTLLAELADRAPSVPVLLLAVVRPDADADLPSGPAVHRLWLRGLEPDEVADYLTELVDRPVPAELAQQLWRRCDGSPAMLAAIAGQLRETDDGRRRVVLRWPDSARAEVAGRLGALSEAGRRVLAAASVVGREFDLSIVESVVGPGALAALDEAVEHGLVRVLPEQVFAFTAALTREICYDSLGLAGAAELHERVADALVGLGARVGERAPTVGELAHHLVHATVLGGAERLDRAVAAAVAVARAAISAGDQAEAVAGYAIAADLAARAQWPSELLGRLFVALGSAHLALAAASAAGPDEEIADGLAAGRAALAAATRLGRHSGDAMLLAEAALGYGVRPGRDITAPPADPDRQAALTEALAALNGRPDADLSTVARLRARLALELAPAAASAQLAADALVAARECADPRAMAEALLAADQPELTAHRQAVREAGVLGDAALLARAHAGAAALLLGLGEVAAGDRQLAAVTQLTGVPWAVAQAHAHRHLLAGRVGDALRYARSAGRLGRAAGHGAAEVGYAVQYAAIALVHGAPDVGGAGEPAAVLGSLRGTVPRWVSALTAWQAAATGEPGYAAALTDEVLAAEPTLDPWTAVLLAEALPAGVVDDRVLGALLAAFSGAPAWLVVGPAAASAGPVALVEAGLLTRAGDLAAAARRLETAGRLVGTTPWLPWLRLVRARWLLARGGAGDGDLAAKELKAARVGAVDRGLAGLVVRIDEVAPLEGGGLTRRERDVLELAVAGAAAREIAERLVIGERTVETHLANIYRKLGVRNRVELIARWGDGNSFV